MLVIGHHRNKVSRRALHYLLRACHQPEDIEMAKKALVFYQGKAVEINEDTVLLFAKACCRVGRAQDGVKFLADPSLRLGLWSNAAAWNCLLVKLEAAEEENKLSESGGGDETSGEESAASSEEGGGEGSGAAPNAVAAAWSAMQALGVAPNATTHHLLVRGLLRNGDRAAALQHAAAAEAAGVTLRAETAAMLTASGGSQVPALDTSVLEAEDPALVDTNALPAEAERDFVK